MAGAILNPDAIKVLLGNNGSDKVYSLSSQASSALLSITNALQASEVEKKVVSSINKKRVPSELKQKIKQGSPTLDVQVGSKVFTTKCNAISIGGNNMATPLFMSGLKNPFGQMMGGRSCYASLSIVTNDPDTIIDVLSLFRSNVVYDTLNNMILQTRSLLKTKGPVIPNDSFTQKIAAGDTVFNGDIQQQLRTLSKSIKRDQLLKIIEEVFVGENDLIYDQQEPMVIKHNLLNSFGYYTFVPTTVSLETMKDTKDSISINLNCQWVDTRFIMKEALKITNINKNFNENHILSWYNSLPGSVENIEKATDKEGFEKKQEELVKHLEYYKGIIAKQGTIFAGAPVLASYALYRYKSDLLDNANKNAAFTQNSLPLYNTENPTINDITNYYNRQVVEEDLLDENSFDIEDQNTNTTDTLGTAFGTASGLIADTGAEKAFSKIFLKSAITTTTKTVGNAVGAVGGELGYLAVSSGIKAWNMTTVNYKTINSVTLDNNLVYTTFKKSNINSKNNNYLYFINLPKLMSNYYLDFINEILLTYSNEDLLTEKIHKWSSEASALLGNEKKVIDKNLTEDLKKIVNHTSPDNSNCKIFVYKNNAFILNTSIANEIYTDIKEKKKEAIYKERKENFSNNMEDYTKSFKAYNNLNPNINTNADKTKLIKDLYNSVVANMGINCFSIIQSIDDLPVNTLKEYFRNINQDQIKESVAATYSMITFNNLHDISNMITSIDTFINIYIDIKNNTSLSLPSRIAQIDSIINLLTETKNKIRIPDLSEKSKKILAKRARTLIAYGNNYGKADTKATDTLIFKSSVFIITAILQQSFIFSHIPANNKPGAYYTFFEEPYKATDLGFWSFWGKEFIKNFNSSVILGVLLGVLAFAVAGLIVGATFGLAFFVVLIIIEFGIAITGYLINSISHNLLPDAVKSKLKDTEVTINDLINTIPKMYFGYYLINNITSTYDSDFLFLKNDVIYPPTILGNYNGSINNIEDPDTHLTIPLPYYRESKKVLHPGFWIWTEKSEETDRIIRESQVSVAIAETAATETNYDRDEIQSILNATGNNIIDEALTINSDAAVNVLLKNIFKLSIIINLIKIGALYGSKFGTPGNTLLGTYLTPSSTNTEAENIKASFVKKIYNDAKVMLDKLTPNINLASSAFDMNVSILQNLDGKLFISGKPASALIAELAMPDSLVDNLPVMPSLKVLDITTFYKNFPDLNNQLEEIVSKISYRNGVAKTVSGKDNSEISYNQAKTEINRFSIAARNIYTTASENHFKENLINTVLDGMSIKNIPSDLTISIQTLKESVGTEDTSSSFAFIINKTKNLKQKILGGVEVKRKKTLREIRQLSAFIQNTGASFGEVGMNLYKQRLSEVINKSKYKKYSAKGAKTNPTFKVYFIQDNNREWLLMDDFYSYSGIESIETYDEANSPIQVCKLVVSNFTNALSSLMGDRLNRENPLMSNTSYDAQVSAIFLKPGCKVKVFLGYGTRLREEDCVFTGEIVNMQGEQIREIICQSHGALLAEYISVEIPTIISASLYDLPERRNIYSIHDLLITKMLQSHLIQKVPRVDGRLGDVNNISGPSAIDSDFTRIQVNTIKENLQQFGTEVVYNTLVKTFDIKIPNSISGGIDMLLKDSDKKFYNVSENIRIFNAPINDTTYINIYKKDEILKKMDPKLTTLTKEIFNPAGFFDEWANKGTAGFFKTVVGIEKIGYALGEFLSDVKTLFGYEKWAQLQTISHNETYWDYIQEMLLQLPNHAAAIRSFEERNTLVITDTTRGYYRTGRRSLTNEKITQQLINRIEPIKGNTIQGFELILNNLFLPTEDSMALFILFYIYLTRILTKMESESQSRIFYETPNEGQINAVVNLLELLMTVEGAKQFDKSKDGNLTLNTQIVNLFTLLHPIYHSDKYPDTNQQDKIQNIINTIKNKYKPNSTLVPGAKNFSDKERILYQSYLTVVYNIFNANSVEEVEEKVDSWYQKNAIKNSIPLVYNNMYTDLKQIIDDSGFTYPDNTPNVANNNVDARILAISILFENQIISNRIKRSIKNPTDTSDMLKFLVENFIAAETAVDLIAPNRLDDELGKNYELFTKGEAIRLTCSQILDWVLQTGYSRSSLHRKFSENHYKSTGKDIITNQINLQKGFNAVEVSILSSPDKYNDLDNIDTAEKAENNIVTTVNAQVNSDTQDKNLYKTFIKNGYQPDMIASDFKVGACMSVNVLCNLVRDYYGGQLILVGDSDIKSWDIITLYDEMSDMFGTIQVKSVSHSYSKNTGWITIVTPWLPTVNQYGSSKGPEIPAMQYGLRALQAVGTLAGIGLGIWAYKSNGRGANLLKRANHYARKAGLKLDKYSTKFATKDFLNKITSPIKAISKTAKNLLKGPKAIADEAAKFIPNSIKGSNLNLVRLVELEKKVIQRYDVLKNLLTSLKFKVGEKIKFNIKDNKALKDLDTSLNSFSNTISNADEKKAVDLIIKNLNGSVEKITTKVTEQTSNDTFKIVKKQFESYGKKLDKKTIEKINNEVAALGNNISKTDVEAIYKNNGLDSETFIKELTENLTTIEKNNTDALTRATKLYTDKLDATIKNINDSNISHDSKTQLVAIIETNKKLNLDNVSSNIEDITKGIDDAYKNQFLNSFDNISSELSDLTPKQKGYFLVHQIQDFHKIGSENLGVGGIGTALSLTVGIAFGLPLAINEFADRLLFNPAETTMSGLISDYYSQNAVAISGLWCKGEPFIANLDGMSKASFTRGQTPSQIYTGRIQKGFDELYEEFQDTLTESANNLQTSSESTVFSNSLLSSEVINAGEREAINNNKILRNQ